MAGESYYLAPNQQYGRKWQNVRPPGLPDWARRAGGLHSALSSIDRIARELWDAVSLRNPAHGAASDVFVLTVRHLSLIESDGARFALPANRFSSPMVTAWGAFQFNSPIWRTCTRRYLGVLQDRPWDATEEQELLVPLSQYRDLAVEVLDAGGSPYNAARGIRVWHIGSGIYRLWLGDAKRDGFERAWERLNTRDPENHRRDIQLRIDSRLRDAGVQAGSDAEN